MINKEDLLAKCLTKTEIFKTSHGEVKLRQLTISESEEVVKIQSDETKEFNDIVYHMVKCSMVEPLFFTEKELESLSMVAHGFIMEIFNEIPLIGLDEKERKKQEEKLKELSKKIKNEAEEDKAKK